MEESFNVFILLHESLKLLPKSWKSLAANTAFSILLPSLFFLMLCSSNQTLFNDIPKSPDFPYIPLFINLLAEFSFLIVLLTVSFISNAAVVLCSAASYTGQHLSSSDLISAVKRTWRRQRNTSIRSTAKLSIYSVIVAVLTVSVTILRLINTLTVIILILLWSVVIFFSLKSSVVNALASVVSVLEEGIEGKTAMERAEKLVEGQRWEGFMVNVFVNVVALGCMCGVWMVLGSKEGVDYVIYGVCFVNLVSIIRIVIMVVYTVLYFQCKKIHGEEMMQYAKVPVYVP